MIVTLSKKPRKNVLCVVCNMQGTDPFPNQHMAVVTTDDDKILMHLCESHLVELILALQETVP